MMKTIKQMSPRFNQVNRKFKRSLSLKNLKKSQPSLSLDRFTPRNSMHKPIDVPKKKPENCCVGVSMLDAPTDVVVNFIFSSIEYLMDNIEENIFRKPGLESRCKLIIDSLDEGFVVKREFLKDLDVPIVAQCLKKYIRDYPNGLLNGLYLKVIVNWKETNKEEEIQNVMKEKMSLPEILFAFYLFKLLNVIHKKRKMTKMDSDSLSTIFTPNLYVSSHDLPDFFRKFFQRGQFITKLLIEKHEKIFQEVLDEDYLQCPKMVCTRILIDSKMRKRKKRTESAFLPKKA